jgi:uncharacterized protein YbcI
MNQLGEQRESEPQTGGDLLMRISNEMVRAQKKFFGKGPDQAKSYLLDDMLVIVMRGGMTTAEETMLDFGQADMVREFRQLFENEMTGRLTHMIQELTGRKVVNYQSQVMFDPHIVVEMFVFDEPAARKGIEATAEGQLRDDDVGAAGPDALGQPADAGR